ncbi:uncharacterized protein CLUP02_04390 [Colletotrichum lupini]|uniref:Uncharacterized protein n=1 Tax=Colletotrichum lupini TaxID=145971 RepID=A0A9Q8SL76_9PEZI|nr:uncharacterized protein CLUP02_04390 [Colletotrichum lupini]UQC78911.1 hypothetical protein CLUP02_04390 [Colletotrichum lupini]
MVPPFGRPFPVVAADKSFKLLGSMAVLTMLQAGTSNHVAKDAPRRRVPSAALFKQTVAPQHVRTPFSALLSRGQGKGEGMSCRQGEPEDVIRGLCGYSDTLHLNASSVQMDNQGNPFFVPTLSRFETSSTATRRPPQNTLESLSSGSFNLHCWPAFVLPVGQPPGGRPHLMILLREVEAGLDSDNIVNCSKRSLLALGQAPPTLIQLYTIFIE